MKNIMKPDNTPAHIRLLLWVYIAVFCIVMCSCSEDNEPEPLTDCYEIAKQLEREQFEAYQDYAPLSEIQAIRDRYAELYPDCRWD